MTRVTTLTRSAHTALLAPTEGVGLLLMPRAEDDLQLTGPSLHHVEHDEIVAELIGSGWEPVEHEDPTTDLYGGLSLVGVAEDGREAFALALDSLAVAPTAAECAEALAGLVALARVIVTAPATTGAA